MDKKTEPNSSSNTTPNLEKKNLSNESFTDPKLIRAVLIGAIAGGLLMRSAKPQNSALPGWADDIRKIVGELGRVL